MKQSKLMSFVETALSTLIGLAVALATQVLVFPLFGFHPSIGENIAITGIFTVVSIARQFVVRRLFEALHIRRPLSPFMQAVIAERFRQIEDEGWSLIHDDAHKPGELARAGAAYAIHAAHYGYAGFSNGTPPAPPKCWPWNLDWWKPKEDYRRDLVRATALVLAEGERHDRSRKSGGTVTVRSPASSREVA